MKFYLKEAIWEWPGKGKHQKLPAQHRQILAIAAHFDNQPNKMKWTSKVN